MLMLKGLEMAKALQERVFEKNLPEKKSRSSQKIIKSFIVRKI